MSLMAPGTTRWDVVLAVVMAGVFVAFQIGKAPAALPVLRAELDLSLVTAGWVISMFNVIGIATGMAAGAAADRLGHRRMMAAGVVVTALASALGAAALGPATILIARFLEGFGFIVTVVAGPGLIALAAEPRHHKLAFGLWGSYMPAGTAAMMLVAPAIMAAWGWRGLWLVNAVLLLGFAVVLLRLTGDFTGARRAAAPSVPPVQAIRLTLAAPAPWLLALCFGCYTGQFLAVLGFLPVMLVEERGFDNQTAASLVALAIAINVPGNLVGGMLLHRNWPRWLLIALGAAAMGLSTLGIYNDGVPDWLRFLLVLLFSLMGGLVPASVLGAAPVFAPRPALVGTTTGLIMQGSNLGQTLGPPAVAALVTASGSWSSAPLVLVTAAALAICFAIAIRRQELLRRG
jgi:MFS family permease